jgi:putative effector of murein hydrolase
MSENPFSLWVYLSQSPLLWLTVTLLTYAITDAVSLATGRHPLANPVLHSIWIIGAFLMLTGTSYTTYFGGAQFVHFLLGPATVALAVPLYENRKQVIAAILPMLLALVVGSITAIVSVVLLAEAAGLPRAVILSLAPKSVTAGVAMGISESLHADPSLTAVAVVLTGIMGAIIVTPLMNRVGITDFRARICRRHCRAWHRYRARVPGRRGRGRIRRHRHEPQCAADIVPGAGRRHVLVALICR